MANNAGKQAKIPPSMQPWIEARKRFRLSHAHVQTARELGSNPKKLGKLAGANINARDDKRWTPLHVSAKGGHEAIAQALIEAGASVGAPGPHELSPIFGDGLMGQAAANLA